MKIVMRWSRIAVAAVAMMAPVKAWGQTSDAPVRDARRFIQPRVISWRDYRDNAVVKQQRDYSCGAAAMATLLQYYWGDAVSEGMVLDTIESILPADQLRDRARSGLTMTDLRQAAVKQGYLATIGTLDLDKLSEVKIPVIVAIRVDGVDHFVVLRGLINGWAFLADPIRGNIRVPTYVFAEQWIDQALLAVARPGKTQADDSKLEVWPEEVEFGWLNQQVPRTLPQRTFHYQPIR